MKILILGASGLLGGILYKKLKEEKDYWVLGTYYESKKNYDLIKLDVTNFIEVKTFFEHFKPDVIVWCLMGKNNEGKLINEGLSNVLNNVNQVCKFIFMSTNAVFSAGKGDFSEKDKISYKMSESKIALYSNAKIDGEKLVAARENYIIIRSGAIYGKNIEGKWDKRITELIEDLTALKLVTKTDNLINTFVEVGELANAIIKLIEMEYKGVIHLGPEKKLSYYAYFKILAKKLNLDETLILKNYMSEEQANKEGIILDMSLNTSIGREKLGIIFSNLE